MYKCCYYYFLIISYIVLTKIFQTRIQTYEAFWRYQTSQTLNAYISELVLCKLSTLSTLVKRAFSHNISCYRPFVNTYYNNTGRALGYGAKDCKFNPLLATSQGF